MKIILGESRKIILQLSDKSPRFQPFELPVCLFEDINSWIHEFTELAIWNTLHKLGCNKDELNKACIKIMLPNKEKRIHTLAHFLSSFHTLSAIKSKKTNQIYLCCPNEYIGFFHQANVT